MMEKKKREWCTTDMMNSDMRHGCVMENDDKRNYSRQKSIDGSCKNITSGIDPRLLRKGQ